jgi:hypothetical protein
MKMTRYARKSMGAGKVDLFRFEMGSTSLYVLLTEGKSSESGYGPSDVIWQWVKSLKLRWSLSKFKDQRIRPNQMREVIWRIFAAKKLDEF